MRTVLAIVIGFALLAGITAAAPRRKRALLALCFIPIWMVACAVDLWYAVERAGYSFGMEVAVHAVIFAIPTATAWAIMRKFSSQPPQ